MELDSVKQGSAWNLHWGHAGMKRPRLSSRRISGAVPQCVQFIALGNVSVTNHLHHLGQGRTVELSQDLLHSSPARQPVTPPVSLWHASQLANA
ncbi:hypothetical protein [Vibrio phage VP882]|uniref:Uncharacterized protein n=1 Tax=Vibrio phage VP882 TaxID=2913982 RepID=A2I312_9CAUD|nr:hypothetical protein VPVV882_gp64 [Vibrio phage VP882]ABM73425.1 hypothetical protein [Vibrio phage VP882]